MADRREKIGVISSLLTVADSDEADGDDGSSVDGEPIGAKA